MSDKVSVAILDEAGNCPETKLPLLCLLPNLNRIIAVGDQNQLPPFTHMSASGNGGRNKDVEPRGFFQRLEAALPAGSIGMLLDQYRMHPRLAQYISNAFYKGKLRTPACVATARTTQDPQGLYWLLSRTPERDPRAASPGGRRGERNSPPRGSTSFSNLGEVHQTLQAVQALRSAGSKHRNKSILVITFYKDQYRLLRETFKKHGLDEVPEGTPGKPALRITTVDQSQGSEADIVLVSCVRSNSNKEIGFLEKPNRVNVAMSRAKDMLIVVGDERTLSKGGRKGHGQWAQLRACAAPIEDARELPLRRSGRPKFRSVCTVH